jgi:GTP-binding protein
MEFSTAEFVIGAVSRADLPNNGYAEIAFAGRSNVGKSSLINKLLNRKKLAHTSSTPGKTRQLNYYLIDERFYFVDLPGYGYVRGGVNLRTQLGKLTEDYLQSRQQLGAVLQLIDARNGPTDQDLAMVDWLRQHAKDFLLVFTKVDKMTRNKLNEKLRRLEAEGHLGGLSFVSFSATTGEGRRDIMQWMSAALKAMPEFTTARESDH